jgi:hypothetical protein
MSLFVWTLPFDLSGMGNPTSSYATAGIALRVTESQASLPLQDGETFGREILTSRVSNSVVNLVL